MAGLLTVAPAEFTPGHAGLGAIHLLPGCGRWLPRGLTRRASECGEHVHLNARSTCLNPTRQSSSSCKLAACQLVLLHALLCFQDLHTRQQASSVQCCAYQDISIHHVQQGLCLYQCTPVHVSARQC